MKKSYEMYELVYRMPNDPQFVECNNRGVQSLEKAESLLRELKAKGAEIMSFSHIWREAGAFAGESFHKEALPIH